MDTYTQMGRGVICQHTDAMDGWSGYCSTARHHWWQLFVSGRRTVTLRSGEGKQATQRSERKAEWKDPAVGPIWSLQKTSLSCFGDGVARHQNGPTKIVPFCYQTIQCGRLIVLNQYLVLFHKWRFPKNSSICCICFSGENESFQAVGDWELDWQTMANPCRARCRIG